MTEQSHKTIGCLLMAAGNAARFRSNKLMADFHGKPLIQWAMERIAAEDFAQVTVVTQYEPVVALANKFHFNCLKNEHPDWGASYTIRLGTAAMAHCDAIVYMVGDQPLLSADALSHLLATWRAQPEYIVAPIHDGKTGNPCIFPQTFFRELQQLQGDTGGKRIIAQHPERLLTVPFPADALFDCDTPEALHQLAEKAAP